MKNFFLDVLKGALIGIAVIIPGVSGGTLAIMLNVYDKMLNAIGNITKEFKKSFFTLLPIGIGILLGIIALIIPLKWALAYYPFPTATLFVALIIGQLPSLYKNVQGNENASNFFIALTPLALVVVLCVIDLLLDTPPVSLSEPQWYIYIVLFFVGFLASSTLVVPGISGSMVLMLLGFYKPIINICDDLLHFSNIGSSILILIPFGIGIIVGFYFMSRLIAYFLNKFKIQTYFAILGFIIGSLTGIYMQVNKQYGFQFDTLQIILSIVLFVIGIGLSVGLNLFNKKTGEKKKVENAEVNE